MSELQRYPDYKDSGVPWLGEIPSHWDVKKLKHMARIQNGSDYKHIQTDEGYPVIGSGGAFAFGSDYLYEGESVLLGRKGTIDKPLYVNCAFWTVDTMYYTKIFDNTYPKFLYYCVLTIDFWKYSTQTALPSMTQTSLSNIKFAVPEFDEQKVVANFLDTELGKIDALISKQKQLLDKLAEQRSAVINHAVTKGLNPKASMKNSGVEWLGRLPQHWLLTRLKNSISSAQNGVWGNEAEEDDNDLVCIRVADFDRNKLIVKDNNLTIRNISKRDYANRGLKVGDLLLEKSGGGDKQLVGCVVLNTLNDKSVCSNFVAKVSLADGMDPRYWTYHHNVLYAAKVNSRSIKQSTGIQNLDSTLYFNELACFPPIEEQRKIAYYLDKETQKVDKMSEAIKNIIVKLQEYRLALITQAVTGKIDVRYISKDLDVEEAG